jgi:excisionase family DNA binding protein
MKNLTVQEMAAECRCHPKTIREALHAGEMPMFRIGRNLVVKRSDFDKWFASKQVAPARDERLLGRGLHAEVANFMRRGARA